MMHKALRNIEEVPYCFFLGHPSNFQVTQAVKATILSYLSKNTRPVAAIKSLTFALLSNLSDIWLVCAQQY